MDKIKEAKRLIELDSQLDRLLQEVAGVLHIPAKQIKSGCRKIHLVYARAVFISEARKLTEASGPHVASKINRDHSTVFHTIRLLKGDDPTYVDAVTKYHELKTLQNELRNNKELRQGKVFI
jgi:chromosomal replication initiation ATPase DnaA